MILLASIFSWPIALAYVAVGLVVAVVGGTLIGQAGDGGSGGRFRAQRSGARTSRSRPDAGRTAGLSPAIRWSRSSTGSGPMCLIGVGIGAAIHNWVPAEIDHRPAGAGQVVVGAGGDAGRHPDVCRHLRHAADRRGAGRQGRGLGTVLAFMMAVTALSLPSIIMLKRVVKMPLLVTLSLGGRDRAAS